MFRRGLQAALLGVITLAMMGAGDIDSRYEHLGHQMICTCSCGQILLECNHLGCPVSPAMSAELKDQLASGANDKATLNWFVSKYGAIVLASPMRGGFDNVAWIMPIAVFLLATIGTGLVVWMWKRRSLRLASAGNSYGGGSGDMSASTSTMSADAVALRDRIRKETEY
jgi:cytochrome c-type biogenesis protein CcmH/NrfF